MGWISDKNIIPRKFWLICGGLLAILALNKLFIIDNIPYKIIFLFGYLYYTLVGQCSKYPIYHWVMI